MFWQLIVADGSAVRLHDEHRLRFDVRLSDDCYRSVVVSGKMNL